MIHFQVLKYDSSVNKSEILYLASTLEVIKNKEKNEKLTQTSGDQRHQNK